MKSLIVAVVGAISLIYLVNPTFGVFELIPDNVPLIGNLDEAAATILLVNCLAYFGFDLKQLFQRKQAEDVDPRSKIIVGKFSQEST